MLIDNKQLFNRCKQWKAYNAWQLSNRITIENNLTKAFHWYCDAWTMASTQNTDWLRQKTFEDKVCRLQKMRQSFALLGETYERP